MTDAEAKQLIYLEQVKRGLWQKAKKKKLSQWDREILYKVAINHLPIIADTDDDAIEYLQEMIKIYTYRIDNFNDNDAKNELNLALNMLNFFQTKFF